MSDDLIKRSDAIEALNECIDIKGFEYTQMHNALMEIPSVDRPQGEWTPCYERLPRKDGTYLVTYEWIGKTGNKYIEIEGIDFEHGRWDCHDYEKVTAWMPLSEPWKGADDE